MEEEPPHKLYEFYAAILYKSQEDPGFDKVEHLKCKIFARDDAHAASILREWSSFGAMYFVEEIKPQHTEVVRSFPGFELILRKTIYQGKDADARIQVFLEGKRKLSE